ncbi:hypothetical protein [Alkalimarinus alittae]|uniref:Uncharacterized protein n=1 Tax=Alkalimarinus alittae TaxID=2961619 RepID=A0ABY6N413_9ALTE|nr:hypothetical protein [Alkalimarinus alittae]UZE96775.1 hypothetical protein NKI27_03215 [Alkalimarinus alittae]
MSTLSVGGILLLFCLIVPMGLHLYKRYQDAQVEKMRRVAQLTHAYRLTQRFLHQIPNQYLTRESKLLLLERAIFFLNKLKKEIPTSQLVMTKLLRNQTMYDALQEHYIKPASTVINSAIEARDAQINLSDFSRFVEIQFRVNAIEKALAMEVLNQANWFSVQCLTDFYRAQSQKASNEGEFRLAIHHLNNEMSEFKKHTGVERAELGVQECVALISENRQLLEAQEDTHEKGDQPSDDVKPVENVLLMKDWDATDDEVVQRKKKQLYG